MAIQDKKLQKRLKKEEKIRLAAEAKQREEEEMKQRHAASINRYALVRIRINHNANPYQLFFYLIADLYSGWRLF